jgi:hypothetical protein
MVTFQLFAGLLVGFLLVLRLGAMWGERKGPQPETRGSTTIESAVFALVAFFIAFSFSSAQTRLEGRTRLLIEEANSLSTAYLRLDLCNPDDQPRLRSLYAKYVALRIDGTRLLPDTNAAQQPWREAELVGNEIWKLSIKSTTAGGPERMLVVGATNEMLDAATRRSRNAEVHVPWLILAALVVMSALAALLAGRSFGSKSKYPDLHQWILAGTFALTLTILIDLDHPRLGFIRMPAGDAAMTAVQQAINSASEQR